MAQNGTTLQDVYDVLVQAQQGQPQQYEQSQQQYQSQPTDAANYAAIQQAFEQLAGLHPDFVPGGLPASRWGNYCRQTLMATTDLTAK